MSLSSRLSPAGTVTKYHGAGPRQVQILPRNSMSIASSGERRCGLGKQPEGGDDLVEELFGDGALLSGAGRIHIAADQVRAAVQRQDVPNLFRPARKLPRL